MLMINGCLERLKTWRHMITGQKPMLTKIINSVALLLGGAGMIKYITRRVLLSIPVLLGIIFVNFTLIRVIPGGPFDAIGQRA